MSDGIKRTTISANGRMADMGDQEAVREVVEPVIREALGLPHPDEASSSASWARQQHQERERQRNFIAQHRELDEQVRIVEEALSGLAERLGDDCELSLGVKTPMRVTRFGELLDAKLTIKVDVKPPKEEK